MNDPEELVAIKARLASLERELADAKKKLDSATERLENMQGTAGVSVNGGVISVDPRAMRAGQGGNQGGTPMVFEVNEDGVQVTHTWNVIS